MTEYYANMLTRDKIVSSDFTYQKDNIFTIRKSIFFIRRLKNNPGKL